MWCEQDFTGAQLRSLNTAPGSDRNTFIVPSQDQPACLLLIAAGLKIGHHYTIPLTDSEHRKR